MITSSDVLIFDLDGTLVQSNEFDDALYKEAISEVLGHCDFNSNWESYRHVTDTGLLGELLSNLRIDDAQLVIDQVREVFCAKVASYLSSGGICEPVPGAPETLKTLRASNIPFGIATGGWGDTARLKLKHAGIAEPAVLSSSDDAISRPAIMSHCLKQLGGEIAHAIYFGDAPWDVRATAELGWRFVGVGKRLAGRCDAWIDDFYDPAWLAAQLSVAGDVWPASQSSRT